MNKNEDAKHSPTNVRNLFGRVPMEADEGPEKEMNLTRLERMKAEMARQDADLKEAFAPLAEYPHVHFAVDTTELEAIEAAGRRATPTPLSAAGAIRC